jgi:hypothetical protein
MMRLMLLCLTILAAAAGEAAPRTIEAGNLVYGGGKTSHCFSNEFLADAAAKADLPVAKQWITTQSGDSTALARVGFAVMTGEGRFTLSAAERTALTAWMKRGGFLLASSSCSSAEWSASFRAEAVQMFGKGALKPIAIDHPVFTVVHDLSNLHLKSSRAPRFEGLFHDGRLVCLFSPEGLNDTAKVDGCCCCGGDEVREARQVVANTLVYALVE